jgi:DNA-binding NarL/FixJ family response regulator
MQGLVLGTDVELVGQIESGAQVLEQVAACKADLVLLDLRLGKDDGFAVLQALGQQFPQLPVLMFSASENLAELTRAFQLGACGYVSKGADREALLTAIRRAVGEHHAWTRPQLRRINSVPETANHDSATEAYLTPREREVLGKLVDGLVNDDIATALKIQSETVKQHVKHILEKLGVEDRTQAALWAIRNGLA